jgi:hypothetical protein
VKLTDEELQAELSKPSKEEGISILKNRVTVSKPQKTKNLREKKLFECSYAKNGF